MLSIERKQLTKEGPRNRKGLKSVKHQLLKRQSHPVGNISSLSELHQIVILTRQAVDMLLKMSLCHQLRSPNRYVVIFAGLLLIILKVLIG